MPVQSGYTWQVDPDGDPIAGAGMSRRRMATVGPYAVKGACNSSGLGIWVNGPSGTADTMYSETRNDSTDLGNFSSSLAIPANTDVAILQDGFPNMSTDYDRFGGTAMLRSGSTTVQVDFNAVVNSRFNPPTCSVYGTAMKAT